MSIVEDQGLKNFVHTLDSRYKIPSRRTIMSRLPETYQSVKRKLKGQLNNTTHIALTTNIWTSLQTKSYCCITAHYITDTWELKSAVLEIFDFSNEHIADNIASEILRVTTEWNIEGKIVCVMTDNASNIVAAINKMPWQHLPCFAHSLNLAIKSSIGRDEKLNTIQQRCMDIVSHFHRSVKSSDKLREVQRQLQHPEHKMYQLGGIPLT